MDIEKEREAFEAWFLNKYQYSAEYFQITKFDADRGFYTAIDHYNPDSVNSAWVLRSSFDSWQAAKAQAVPKYSAIKDVIDERQRQINQEFYSIENDDEYKNNELVRAAVCYADNIVSRGWVCDSHFGPEVYQSEGAPDLWPWDLDFWKPKNPRKDLVRAAALLIAEIERIDRSTG